MQELLKGKEINWGDFADDVVIAQHELYLDIIREHLEPDEEAILSQLLEINRELSLRENR